MLTLPSGGASTSATFGRTARTVIPSRKGTMMIIAPSLAASTAPTPLGRHSATTGTATSTPANERSSLAKACVPWTNMLAIRASGRPICTMTLARARDDLVLVDRLGRDCSDVVDRRAHAVRVDGLAHARPLELAIGQRVDVGL